MTFAFRPLTDALVAMAHTIYQAYRAEHGHAPHQWRVHPAAIAQVGLEQARTQVPARPYRLLEPERATDVKMLFGVEVVPDADVPYGEIWVR